MINDPIRGLLSFIIVVGFLGAAWIVLEGQIKTSDPTFVALIGTVIGYLSAKADQIISYHFGSTKGSSDKDKVIGQAISNASQPPTGGTP
jgi:hypothetical protein